MSTLRRRHRIQARASANPLEIPTALEPQVRLAQTGDWLQIETEGDLAPVLPWLTTLGLHDVRIEPYGLRSVYEQYHGAEDAS
jgi:ABC-2 type transport system ATP-binding protein